ncbi:MAG: LemA family protein [Candidatus Hydrogenedentota bacterium]|nr:MAG: LemA family protein [Candidatus Hydrogenedentota bacterium]
MSVAAVLTGIVVFLLLIVVLVGVYLASLYNRLVKKRNRYENSWSQIDVQMQRRLDLIPNLVSAAKAYLKHERETLEAVIQARNQAAGAREKAAAAPGDPSAIKELSSAEGSLAGAMGRLMVVFEAYPDLKANQNISQVMEELTSTENKIAFARQAYNDFVMDYNVTRESFPAVLFANLFGFKEAALFEVDSEEARKAPKVSFD